MSVRYRSAKSTSSSHSGENDAPEALAGLLLAHKPRPVNRDIDKKFILASLAHISPPSDAITGLTSTTTPVYGCRLMRPVLRVPHASQLTGDGDSQPVSQSVFLHLSRVSTALARGDTEGARESLRAAQTIFQHPEVWPIIDNDAGHSDWTAIIERDRVHREQYAAQEAAKETKAAEVAAIRAASAARPAKLTVEEAKETNSHTDTDAETGAGTESSEDLSEGKDNALEASAENDGDNVVPATRAQRELSPAVEMPAPAAIPELSPVTTLVMTIFFDLCQGELALCEDSLDAALLCHWQAWLAKERHVDALRAEEEAIAREQNNNRARSDTNNGDDIDEDSGNDRHKRLTALAASETAASQLSDSHRPLYPYRWPTRLDWLIWSGLGVSCYHQRDYRAALHCFHTALTLHRQTVQDTALEAVDRPLLVNNIGACLAGLGACHAANAWFIVSTSHLSRSLSATHPRCQTAQYNLTAVQSKRAGFEPSQMVSMMRGIAAACEAKDAEVEIARLAKATKKVKGKGGDAEAASETPAPSQAPKKPLIASVDLPFPPIRDFANEIAFFQTPGDASLPNNQQQQESKEALTTSDQLWLRGWTVATNEYERMLLASAKEAESAAATIKTKGKAKGKAKAQK